MEAAEERQRQAWKREQEQKAKLIQRRFRKYKKSILFGDMLSSTVAASKVKSATGVAEEERVLASLFGPDKGIGSNLVRITSRT